MTNLTDLEYRVWTQYILSADDFGVMRASAVALQADNDALANRKTTAVQKAFDAVIGIGLVHTFDHQGRQYAYQRDWQEWQKVGWPRLTTEPKPPDAAIAACDDSTRLLFLMHPGGKKSKTSKVSGSGSGSTSGELPENFGSTSEELPSTRARGRAERLWLTATAKAEANGSPPFDVWFQELRLAYPPQATGDGPLVQQAFLAIFDRDARDPSVVFAELRAAIENQRQGAQWKAGKIPKLLNWLREGLYTQRHDTNPSPDPRRPSWATR